MERQNYWTESALRRANMRISRRGILRGASVSAAGLTGVALVGCGDDDDDEPTATATAAATGSATGQATASATATAGGAPAGELNIALDFNPIATSFNPLYYTSGGQLPYLDSVSDTLTNWSRQGDRTVFAPKLAESLERAPDALSWTFKLKPNAKFHNDDPVTAEEVKFTWDTLLQTPSSELPGARKTELQRVIASIETPDESTVKFTLNTPYVLDNLIDVRYVSRRLWEELGVQGYGNNPVSNGPFKFTRGELGNSVELTAVPDHYRKTSSVETVRIAYVAEAGTRIARLETGEADIVSIPQTNLEEARNINNARIISTTGTDLAFLSFDGMRQGRFDMPWADPKVRQAISYAIDREGIVKALFANGDGATPHGSFSMRYARGYVDIPVDPYDPAEARKLLAAAGYEDGFEIPYMSSTTPEWAIAVQSYLREVGVDMVFDILDATAHQQRLLDNKLFGITPRGVGIYKPDPSGWGLFTFTNAYYGSNYDTWYDERMTVASSGTDDEERFAAWGEIQERSAEDRVHISLWEVNHFFGLSSKVGNYELYPNTYYPVGLEFATLA
jgi:ABC-type transport system substrate-binding protein